MHLIDGTSDFTGEVVEPARVHWLVLLKHMRHKSDRCHGILEIVRYVLTGFYSALSFKIELRIFDGECGALCELLGQTKIRRSIGVGWRKG